MMRLPTPKATLGSALLALWVTGGCAGCGDDDAGPKRGAAHEVIEEGAGREIVATVDGHPIYADCVQTQATEKRITAREALDECIDFELLALEAERRGYAVDDEVSKLQRREAVRRLIERDFFAEYDGPEDIPPDEVETLWKSPPIHSRYNHPEYRFCIYVRAAVDATVPHGAPADLAAKAAIERAYEATARAPKGGWYRDKWFAAIRDALGDYELEYQAKLYNTPRKGKSDDNFARALFEIDGIRTVSKPVRTKWGWDLLLLIKIAPAARAKLPEVEDELRTQMWNAPPTTQCKQATCETVRQRAFKRWSSAIAKQHEVAVNDRAVKLIHQKPPR